MAVRRPPTLGGLFFGQSSFAQHTIASAKSVVNVAGLGLTRDDLKVLAPFGCGLLTGSGTVVNVAKAGPSDAVAIMGMGGVGLAAVMAAKNAGCQQIIGVDRVPARLELAKKMGATHTIDTTEVSGPGVSWRRYAVPRTGWGRRSRSMLADTSPL
ncbi:hypothetical protein PG993_005551 [Apiospora rasikravindrae]|uniref:Alcohol dehydrogenase-like C-terminal domain-containing protein n=1 Tax=Apiospora rasikravindrae TaxID=990691 RepID=A0ABR1TFY1_9PEZI